MVNVNRLVRKYVREMIMNYTEEIKQFKYVSIE